MSENQIFQAKTMKKGSKKTVLYDIVQDYCRDEEKKNGLLLLPAPTGFGKTHTIFEYMADSIENVLAQKKRYIFLTTQKKNLKFKEDFLPMLPKKYHKHCMQVFSNSDSIFQNLETACAGYIPADIRNLKEFKDLCTEYYSIKRLEQELCPKQQIQRAKEMFSKEVERNFRNKIAEKLRKNFKNYDCEKLLREITTNKSWKWVSVLYPATLIYEKSVIFMSVDKFIYPFSTVISDTTFLYDDTKFLSSAVVFIDEVDATKQTILKALIEQQMNRNIDVIQLFSAIHSTFRNHEFPEKMVKCFYGDVKDAREKEIQYDLKGLKKEANRIYKEYHLAYNYKIQDAKDDNSNNALFQDYKIHGVMDESKEYVAAKVLRREKICSMYFADKKHISDSDIRLGKLLYEIQKYITRFFSAVKRLAINYKENSQVEKENFSYDNAVHSILAEFSIHDEWKQKIANMILTSTNQRMWLRKNDRSVVFEKSFYSQGFKCFYFYDTYYQDTKSVISMITFDVTPELILMRLASNAKVLGVSATAMIPSVISNYSLEYLKEALGERFYKISKEDYKLLRESYQQYNKDYENINIHVDLLGDSKDLVSMCKKITPNDEYAGNLKGMIEHAAPKDEDKYVRLRYMRLLLAFYEYLKNDKIQSFLCLLNKFAKEGDEKLDLRVVEKLFTKLADYNEEPFDFEWEVKILDGGSDYEKKKSEILDLLGDGNKLFVLSTYQTIGAGQNLQYKIPEEKKNDIVYLDNGLPKSKKKDFDAIYLDMPTNIVPMVYADTEDNPQTHNLLTVLFFVEMLYENGEVTESNKNNIIRHAFMNYWNQRRKIYNTSSYISSCDSKDLACTKTIIQALGRLCRTNSKSKDIYVFADYSLVTGLKYTLSYDVNYIFNPEFEALCKKIKQVGQSASEQQGVLENRANVISRKAHDIIHTFLREGWSREDRVQDWQMLREFVLQHPTLSEAEWLNNSFTHNIYVLQPQEGNKIYYVLQESNSLEKKYDYAHVEVSFIKSYFHNREVSAEDCKLNLLMRNLQFKEFFEKQGYTTTFVPNTYIMAPIIFNNIYKGALGEVIGKFILEKYLGVELKELPQEIFEKFDYVVGDRIFIDFKLWHDSTYQDSEKFLKRINEKAVDCKAKCVIVVNILTEGTYVVQKHVCDDGLFVIIVPNLLTNDACPQVDEKAIRNVREYINEYANKN